MRKENNMQAGFINLFEMMTSSSVTSGSAWVEIKGIGIDSGGHFFQTAPRALEAKCGLQGRNYRFWLQNCIATHS